MQDMSRRAAYSTERASRTVLMGGISRLDFVSRENPHSVFGRTVEKPADHL